MQTNTWVTPNSGAIQNLFQFDASSKEAIFLNMSSEKIVGLIEGLNKDSLCSAIDVLLSRETNEDLLWQIKGLQKLSKLKRQVKNSWLQNSAVLKGVIKKSIKKKVGDVQLHALIALITNSAISLPDELVYRLVITHESNHWIPLLSEQQRVYCFNELLRCANDYAKYTNLIDFLSVNEKQAQIEMKQIVADLLQKYPQLLSVHTKKSDDDEENLAILKLLPVFILSFNDKNHRQFLDSVLPKLKDENANVRLTILKVLSICIPHLHEQDRLVVYDTLQVMLDDKDRIVRFEAQQIITKCRRHLSSLMTNSPKLDHEGIDVLLLKLQDKDWQVRKSVLKMIADSRHHIRDESKCLQVFNAIFSTLNETIWFIYPVALEAIAACMPKLKEEQHQQVLDLVLPTASDDDWSYRYMALQAIQGVIAHLDKKHYQKVLNAILPRINDNHPIVRGAALQVLYFFVPDITIRTHQKVLEAILPKLNETNSYVHNMARRLIIKFMSYLSDKRHQMVLDILLVKNIDEHLLKDLVKCVPYLNKKGLQQVLNAMFPHLNDDDWKVRRSVIQVLAACISYLNVEEQQEVLNFIFPKLNDESLEVCEEALKAILIGSLSLTDKNRSLLCQKLQDHLIENSFWDDELFLNHQ